MAASDKDTIYVDIDDEITTIIDKVHNSERKIIALVLPKRATVFQSIVNMKLLKRAADVAKKHLVLITTETNLLPLAGVVGLHVAPTPQSKPEVPSATEPGDSASDEPVVEDPGDDAFTAANAGDLSVGELAQRSGHVVAGDSESAVLTLPEDEADTDAQDSSKRKKDRKLAVPNFSRFRLYLILLIIIGLLVIPGLYVCLVVLPKASIIISTNTSTVNVNLNPTLDTSAQKLDSAKLVLPAKSEQQQKTTSQQVNTTGEKNTGDAATGTVDMTATACAPHLGTPDSVPAGTGISTNGLTFITQDDANFSFDHFSGGSCAVYTASSISITAISGGTKYNVSSVDFTVAGRSDVTANGSASGGTDNIINVVAQADIDNAKKKLAGQDTDAIKASLEQALRLDGMYPLPETFNTGTPVITTSANVGDTADTLTVTQAVTYTMFGAKQADLDMLIKASVATQIDSASQSILDDGLSNATITITDASATAVQIQLQTKATVGPDINANDIRREAAGKKVGDVKALVNHVPGVTNVDVRLSPFWVGSVPSDQNKITVSIGKAS